MLSALAGLMAVRLFNDTWPGPANPAGPVRAPRPALRYSALPDAAPVQLAPVQLMAIRPPTPRPRAVAAVRRLPVTDVVALYVAMLREHGLDGEWMASEAIQADYVVWCAREGIEPGSPSAFLAALGGTEGVSAERRRLNAPELSGVKRYLQLRRGGELPAKAEMYRVATEQELAAIARQAKERARQKAKPRPHYRALEDRRRAA